MAKKNHSPAPLAVIILCGGSGSRLWPRSRAILPKPFIRMPDGGRLIDQTYARIAASLLKPAAVITTTSADYAALCETGFADHGPDDVPHWVIAEPIGRNTGPAVAMAAALCRQRLGDETILLVLPSDHTITDIGAFWQAAGRAIEAAGEDRFLLLGVEPEYPATRYGYIQRGDKLAENVYAVRQFVEKPNKERATDFLQRGDCYWNAGVFCFAAGTLIRALPELAPDIAACLMKAVGETADDDKRISPDRDVCSEFPAISFDRAVMEKVTGIAVVEASGLGWSDVGTWQAVSDKLIADERGNRINGDAILLDSDDCAVIGDGRFIAAIGIKNTHIIDSPDALLVASADESHRADEVFHMLRGRNEAERPTTVTRPWGSYTVLAEGSGHKVKRIDVHPGAQLSLQSHARRSEHWITVIGTMTVTVDERTFDMKENESCFIPCGARHRMANNTQKPAAVIEVQTGSYLGEDDIVRYEDMYGRVDSR